MTQRYLKINDFQLKKLCTSVHIACDRIMDFYGKTEGVSRKKDGSYITLADKASEDILVQILQEISPDIVIISEELFAENPYEEHEHKDFWCVDPIDGTEGFVKHNGMFCISIALILNKIPVFGLIAHPISRKIWHNHGGKIWQIDGQNAPQKLLLSANPTPSLKRAITSTHFGPRLSQFLEEHHYEHSKKLGSALKFIELLKNNCDLYPRLSSVSEWDIAAGDALLRTIGGCVLDMEGNPVTYGNKGFKTSPFIAYRQRQKDPAT